MDFNSFTSVHSFVTEVGRNIDVLQNLAKSMEPVQYLLKGLAYLLGLAFAFKALYSLRMYGEGRTMMSSSTSIKEPLTYLLVAAVILFLPASVKMMLNSSFGSTSILAYTSVSSRNATMNYLWGSQSEVGSSLAMVIQTIGYVAFIRGWMMIAKAAGQGGGQQASTGKGLVHVFGGILAINIVSTLQIVNNTLYGT